jgi:hypothetical protein
MQAPSFTKYNNIKCYLICTELEGRYGIWLDFRDITATPRRVRLMPRRDETTVTRFV